MSANYMDMDEEMAMKVAITKETLSRLYKRERGEAFRAFDELVNFLEYLKRKYPEWSRVLMWHIAARSTPSSSVLSSPDLIFDLEGEDNIFHFVQKLGEKFQEPEP